MFLRLGVLTYNLFMRFKQRALGREWQHHQVRAVRCCLYQTAERLVSRARRLVLKVSSGEQELITGIRHRHLVLYRAAEPSPAGGGDGV